mmetsp:Transcript_57666/g.95343  ORF Transcript_57666/g.95343 Transcript_57666/m.95343 type:complete len:430 (+) Transcript_57666:190-1479(+)
MSYWAYCSGHVAGAATFFIMVIVISTYLKHKKDIADTEFQPSCLVWSCSQPLITSLESDWPEPRPELRSDALERWKTLHSSHVVAARTQSSAQIVFLGDSITEGWIRSGFSARGSTLPQPACEAIWNASFSRWRPLNFGIGGDRIQDLGWRLQHGLLPHTLQPRAFVVAIGTNDIGNGESADAALAELTTLILWLHTRRPATSIIVVGLFPRGEDVGTPRTPAFHRSPWWVHAWNKHRAKIERINRGLKALPSEYGSAQWMRYVDCSHVVLARADSPADQLADKSADQQPADQSADKVGGTNTKASLQYIDLRMSYDLLHLTPRGYSAWAKCLAPHIAAVLARTAESTQEESPALTHSTPLSPAEHARRTLSSPVTRWVPSRERPHGSSRRLAREHIGSLANDSPQSGAVDLSACVGRSCRGEDVDLAK